MSSPPGRLRAAWVSHKNKMNELKPQSVELMAWYWDNLERFEQVADELGRPKFSADLRSDLAVFLRDNRDLRLIEARTRMGHFDDVRAMESARKAVSRHLKARKVKESPGKRTAPGLRELVAELTPMLLAMGLPLATGGRSRLVRALQMIAIELDVPGDPRDELRKLRNRDLVDQEDIQRSLFKTIADAIKKPRA